MNHRVTSVAEMKQLDQLTIIKKGIDSFDLMHFASERMVDYVLYNQLVSKDQMIVIVCGPGNNGGDGLVIFECLNQLGFHVEAFVVDQPNRYTREVKQQLDRLKMKSIQVHKINNQTILDLKNTILHAHIIIDALLGIGLNRPCEPIYCDIIDVINDASKTVISVDIPSGLHANNGHIMNHCVVATHSLVVGAFKYGNLMADALDVSGQLHFIDIDIMTDSLRERTYSAKPLYFSNHPRKHHTHKYHYGHVLVVGGHSSMMGSIGLTSLGALRGGAGLVSVATYGDYGEFFRELPLEVMTLTYQDIQTLLQLFSKKDAVVYGMGVSKNTQPVDVVSQLIVSNIPCVIDADGIEHLSKINIEDYQDKHIVLTPHMKELSTLLHIPFQELIQDPITYVESFVKGTNLVIVLKGPCTIIASDKKTVFIQAGNPGLATAGTGDVLAGIIGSMIAQKKDIFLASLIAVEIFSIAANLACNQMGERSMIASDVIACLPEAFKQRT